MKTLGVVSIFSFVLAFSSESAQALSSQAPAVPVQQSNPQLFSGTPLQPTASGSQPSSQQRRRRSGAGSVPSKPVHWYWMVGTKQHIVSGGVLRVAFCAKNSAGFSDHRFTLPGGAPSGSFSQGEVVHMNDPKDPQISVSRTVSIVDSKGNAISPPVGATALKAESFGQSHWEQNCHPGQGKACDAGIVGPNCAVYKFEN